MENSKARANQKKWSRRFISIALVLTLCFAGITEMSFASTVKTRYAKEQAFYSDTGLSQRIHFYVKGVYGKGEKIKTRGIGYYNGIPYCRLKERMRTGSYLWIQKSLTTAQKPKIAYSVSRMHRALRLKPGTKLRIEPRSKAKYFRCRDTNVITLGKTSNGWYKVFVNGKVGFIKKDSSKILSNKKAGCIPLKFDNYYQDIQAEVEKSIMYFYAMMPERARKQLKQKCTNVTFPEKFEIEWLQNGPYAGYSTGNGQIYLKDTSNLETTFLHEVGHVLTLKMLENKEFKERAIRKCYPESKRLPFDSYHRKNIKEYLAEAFAYYVLMPQRLQKNAPDTYHLFQEILGYQ